MSIGYPHIHDANIETLSANKTLTISDAYHQSLDTGGEDRDITLPAEAVGLGIFISNRADAAESLVVKNDASPAVTIVTIGQNGDAILCCDGTNWRAVLSKGNT